ncbi:Anti-lipopolysaccharide factor/Scygonadin [Trinorchestia longiramus]|nr:Anti-lipopolysaccharide factor/Scygonadin [Trinorchestia longiramus]
MGKTSVVAVLLVAALCAQQPQAQNLADLIPLLVSKISTLWDSGEHEFLGSTCDFTTRPTIYSWELYYLGRFWCPEIGNVVGKSKTRSRSSVLNKAIEDFLRKAIDKGLVTEEQAATWLGQ